MNNPAPATSPILGITWPTEGLTRVPNRLYSDADPTRRSRQTSPRPHLEFRRPGGRNSRSWRLQNSFVGDTPVIAVRDRDGGVNVLENRCAHRGALVCLKEHGNARSLACVYHAWNYSLKGDLIGVAFERGVKGEGGMPKDFDKSKHGPAQAAGRDLERPDVRHLQP